MSNHKSKVREQLVKMFNKGDFTPFAQWCYDISELSRHVCDVDIIKLSSGKEYIRKTYLRYMRGEESIMEILMVMGREAGIEIECTTKEVKK